MIALVQRVNEASVSVSGQIVGSVGPGYLILLGIHVNDTETEMQWLARKCAALRIFRDEDGVMNRSIVDTDGDALVVSQFTLYGDARKGNRPSFVSAARPEIAEPLYNSFVAQLGQQIGKKVETGVFGAMMDVALVNDGPVTIWLERPPSETTSGAPA